MNWSNIFDSSLSSRICLTLLHSLWQVGLLAILPRFLAPLRKKSVEIDYAVHLGALLAAVIALPITFAIVDVQPVSPLVRRTVSAGVNTGPITALQMRSDLSQTDTATASAPTAISPVQSSPHSLAMKSQEISTVWPVSASLFANLYAIGVIAMLARLAIAITWAERLRNHARPIMTGAVVDSLSALARQWSLRSAPVLACVESIVMPKVIGLLRPVILLPASALAGLSADDLQMVLIHELAHVRRYDLWGNLIQRLAEVVLFFNPAAWYLSGRISTLREYCCDEMTCRALAGTALEQRLQYATALLHIVELVMPAETQRANLAALAISGQSPSELRRRVARLLDVPLTDPIRFSRGGMIVLAAVASLTIFGPLLSKTDAQTSGGQKSNAKSAKAPATATKSFSFGSKIEILALGADDVEPKQWWDIEGQPIESVSSEWPIGGKVSGVDTLCRRVVFRIHEYPKGAHTKWSILHATSSTSTQRSADGKQPSEYFAGAFGVPQKTKTAALKVGIAIGPWKTIFEATGATAGSSGREGLSFVFSDPVQSADETVVVVSHDCFEQNFRVIAVDKKDATHLQSGDSAASSGKICQSTIKFKKLKLEDIDHFEFQIRDYEWIEFDNLPLHPSKSVSLKARDDQQNHNLAITGRVVDSQNHPITQAKVWAGRPVFDEWTQIATTDAQGKFQVTVDRTKVDELLKKWPQGNILKLWITAAGYGRVLTDFDANSLTNSVAVTLEPAKSIEGRILTIEGKPVSDARIRVVEFGWNGPDKVEKYLDERRHAHGYGAFHTANTRKYVAGPGMSEVTTDPKGQFKIDGFRREQVIQLEIEGTGIANDIIGVITRDAPLGNPANGVIVSRSQPHESAYYSVFTHLAVPGRSIRGTVRDKLSGQPLAGIRVSAFSNHDQPIYTNNEGRFEVTGLLKEKEHEFEFDAPSLPYFSQHPRVKDTPGLEPITVDIGLVRGSILKGRLIDAATGKPAKGTVEYAPLFGNVWVDKLLTDVSTPFSQCMSGDDGVFEIACLPGPGVIGARSAEDQHPYLAARLQRDRVVELIGREELDASQESKIDFLPLALGEGSRGIWSAGRYHAVALVNPNEREIPSEIALEFVLGITRKGTLRSQKGQPFVGAMVMGLKSQGSQTFEPSKTAEFSVEGLDPKGSRELIVLHRQKQLAGRALVDGATSDAITIQVSPCATLTGRLVSKGGTPLAKYLVEAYPVESNLLNPGWWRAETDAEGRFQIHGMVPECPFNLTANAAMKMAGIVKHEIKLVSGETKDLGDITDVNQN